MKLQHFFYRTLKAFKCHMAHAFTVAIVLAAATWPAHAAPQKVTVLLDWFVNPDHAPLIIAKEKGFFAAQGLDVTLVPPADPNLPPKLVAAQKADIAVSYQPQLHMHVDQGMPLVRFATLVASPLNTVVAEKNGAIKSLKDLKGKKVGYSVGGFEEALLGTMLKSVGLSMDDVELVNVNFSLSPAIYAGQVDAVIGAFRNFELNQMALDKRPGIAFYPEENGVPAYDELILIAHKTHADPQMLRAFNRALEDATLYVINHPQDAWETFVAHHPELNDTLNKRAWQDTLPRFALRPGALDRARYARFATFMQENGLIQKTVPIESYAIVVK